MIPKTDIFVEPRSKKDQALSTLVKLCQACQLVKWWLFLGEGAGTIWQVDKLDTDAVIMANIKQDELWVDLLFDGTASFYLALAESKRFRLGHIRNGKISYRLYPKRKDFVSLNVAIKNLARVRKGSWPTNQRTWRQVIKTSHAKGRSREDVRNHQIFTIFQFRI